MTILEAKEEIKNTVKIYLDQNARDEFCIPYMKQRPIFMIGAPGIGKTAIVEQIAAEMNIGLVCYSMTHHTRQSAIGLPYIIQREYRGEEVRVSEYTMSEIIASVYDLIESSGKTQGILFLDEINCVSETLSPAILQFLQYKRFGNHSLPKGWVIISAGNPPQYNKSVKDFDIATRDRLKYIHVEEDFDSWRKYAHNEGVHGAITAFLEVNKNWFYRIQTTADGPVFATARGWEDLSFALKGYERHQIRIGLPFIIQYITDPEIARRFAAFYELYKKYREEYKIQDILEGKWNPETVKQASEAGFDERISLIELIEEALTQDYCSVMEQQAVLELTAADLRAAKRLIQEDVTDTVIIRDFLLNCSERKEEELQKASRAGFPATQENIEQRLSAVLLRELAEKADLSKSSEKAFASVKRSFDAKAKKQAAAVDTAKSSTENSFQFIEKCFGAGQEMNYFMTVLTANRHSSSFISRFGSESYFRYNKNLLLSDVREELRKDIQAEGYGL